MNCTIRHDGAGMKTSESVLLYAFCKFGLKGWLLTEETSRLDVCSPVSVVVEGGFARHCNI